MTLHQGEPAAVSAFYGKLPSSVKKHLLTEHAQELIAAKVRSENTRFYPILNPLQGLPLVTESPSESVLQVLSSDASLSDKAAAISEIEAKAAAGTFLLTARCSLSSHSPNAYL